MAANPISLLLERRSKERFPLALNVRYRTPAMVGTGHTVNVSSNGLLIASDEHIVEEGHFLKVSLEWPARLNGTTPLQLIVEGRVVRSVRAGFAVRMERYQFRTLASGPRMVTIPQKQLQDSLHLQSEVPGRSPSCGIAPGQTADCRG